MTKKIRLAVAYSSIIVSVALLCANNASADIVFPAIAHQFMVGLVVPPYCALLMAFLILNIETFFIWDLLSLNFAASFMYSFLVNLISSIAGIFIVSFSLGEGMGVFSYGNMRLGTYLGLIPGYLLTVLLEGVVLFLIARVIKRKVKIIDCAKTSMIMNFFSYLVILAGIFIVDFFTGGKYFRTY